VVFAVADVAAVGTAVVALDRQAVEKPSLGFLGNRDEAVVVAVAVVVVVTVAAEVVLAHLVVEAGAVGNPESLQKNVVDEVHFAAAVAARTRLVVAAARSVEL